MAQISLFYLRFTAAVDSVVFAAVAATWAAAAAAAAVKEDDGSGIEKEDDLPRSGMSADAAVVVVDTVAADSHSQNSLP